MGLVVSEGRLATNTTRETVSLEVISRMTYGSCGSLGRELQFFFFFKLFESVWVSPQTIDVYLNKHPMTNTLLCDLLEKNLFFDFHFSHRKIVEG